ncbi:MAG: lysylphosphatidylglycerol synthase transmembrane domain-containing protein [Candidatus Latescibacterota bacterium]|nr:lysylphosphatidylglycerol synthase transmembrane domain-containing protein [Candidatus Latescibacterota bacterium]
MTESAVAENNSRDSEDPGGGRRFLPGLGYFLAKALVSVGLLYYLLSELDLEAFSRVLSQTAPLLFAGAVGLFLLSNALGALQWYLLLRAQNLAVSLRQAVVFYWVGVFFNNVLLGNIGGDALRIYDIRRLTGEGSGAAAATFMDRFVGLFSTCFLALSAYALIAEVRVVGVVSVLLPVWLALVCLLAMGLSRRLGIRVQNLIDRLLPAQVASLIANLRQSIVVYRHCGRLLVIVWLVSLGVQLSRILVYWTAGAAVGLVLDLSYFVGFQPVAAVIAALPISIGGLGVREGVLVELFGLVGANEPLAFAMSLLGYAAGIVASLMGGIAFIFRRVQPDAHRKEAERPSSATGT